MSRSEEHRYKTVTEMLTVAGRTIEKNIMGKLEEENPQLAQDIKKLMFVFEDIVYIDDRSMQKILTQIDGQVLAMALKATDDAVREKILNNMSKRARQMIQEEREALGPVPLSEVEAAQQEILNVISKLDEEGEITIYKGGEGVQLVE